MSARREVKKKPAQKRVERQAVAAEAQAKIAPVEGKTAGQKRYLKSIKANDVTVAVGPAGTGKTYMAAAYAAQMIRAGQVRRVILCRPAVEATGERLGFLPGDMQDKMAPWTAPVLDVLREKLGKAKVEAMIDADDISVVPFAFMRGRTFKDAFVICDEAQNCTVKQMELLTGRFGENIKVVIDGDIQQSDIGPDTGLAAIYGMVEMGELESVGLVEMDFEDIVRSAQCKQFIKGWAGYHTRQAA